MSGATLVRQVRRLQRSQLSVQGLTRLVSVYVFLLASWTDTDRLALVALQGMLLGIPYTLLEALVGRPISAGLVPADWDVQAWARRAAGVTVLPVGAVGYLSATVALPQASVLDRLLLLSPVLLQLPLEALFWATARTGSAARANALLQLTALGTLVTGAAFAALDVRLDVAAVPAQALVLAWALTRRRDPAGGVVRPTAWVGVRLGSVYCVAAAVDLSYTIALPSVAGAVAGPSAVVVLRALELAFGPFHVVLSASTREDVVAGRRSRVLTPTRVLTAVALVAVAAALLGIAWVRRLLAEDLAVLGLGAIAAYCGYKAMVMISTWLSVRHMIFSAPRRYLTSSVGSRVVAFGGLALAVLWVDRVDELAVQLLIAEVVVVAWFGVRMRGGTHRPEGEPAGSSPSTH